MPVISSLLALLRITSFLSSHSFNKFSKSANFSSNSLMDDSDIISGRQLLGDIKYFAVLVMLGQNWLCLHVDFAYVQRAFIKV